MLFYKIDNFYWELENDKLYNMAGGHQLAEWYNIKKSEIIYAEDWDDLDWLGTEIYNNDLKTGWINREGEFFGCGYHRHSKQADFVHKKSERELELLGWIKIFNSEMFKSENSNGLSMMIVSNRINDLQKVALRKLDFKDEEIKYRGGSI